MRILKDFKKDKYCIIKKGVNPAVTQFCHEYLRLKREVVSTFFRERFISPYEKIWGIWTDPQAPETYACYSDIVMETMLVVCLPLIEHVTKKKLYPTYSYTRLYKKGDILKRHKDRFSCEISATLNLGGDPWPIFLEPNPRSGRNKDDTYIPGTTKGEKIILNSGDLLIYRGELLEHWREPFEGKECGQVFLHYNNQKTQDADINKFDTRPHLGLPQYFKKKK